MRLFEIIDVFGQKIVLTAEQWNHIVLRHPEVQGLLHEIEATIASPQYIVRSSKADYVYLYHRKFKKLQAAYMVIVYHTTRKFVITAYLSDVIKQGELLWKKD